MQPLEAVEVVLQLRSGHEDKLHVTPLGRNRYRLEDASLQSLFDGEPLYYGDIIEAELEGGNVLRVSGVVERSSLRAFDVVLPRDVQESEELARYLDKIVEAGGYFLQFLGGGLLVQVPPSSGLTPEPDLTKLCGLVSRRQRSTASAGE
jgi:hypothetical protein